MPTPLTLRRGLAAAALSAALALPAAAQLPGATFSAVDQDALSVRPLPPALAMGDAVAAVPGPQTAFFANPAHGASLDRLHLTVVGVTAGVGGDLWDAYSFYRDELGPAIEEGLSEIRDEDPERLRELYDRAFEVGRRQKTASAAAQALAVQANAGPVALGVGAFGAARARARVVDVGAGIPYLDTYTQADLYVPVTVAAEVPGAPLPLSVGASATWVQRRVTAKADYVESLDPDGEKAYLLKGSTLAFGAGALARDVGLPGLDLGASVQGLGAAPDLRFDEAWSISGSEAAPDDAAEIAELEARFNGRAAAAELRLGAAYRLPLQAPGLDDTSVSVDWVSGSTSELDQGAATGLRLGVRTRLAKVLDLRAGLAQGYPSAGVGLDLKYVRLDYATYGVEDGRTFGQLGRRAHLVQLRLGIL